MKAKKQDWSVGATVKVGFLTLKVEAKVPTPGDYLPDAYVLSRGTDFYTFVPHNGLTKVSESQARAMVSVGKRIAASPVDVLEITGAEATELMAQYFAGEEAVA